MSSKIDSAHASNDPTAYDVGLDFVFNDTVKQLLSASTKFLYENKKVPAEQLRDGAVDDSIAREVMEARSLTSPLGQIKGQPMSAFSE